MRKHLQNLKFCAKYLHWKKLKFVLYKKKLAKKIITAKYHDWAEKSRRIFKKETKINIVHTNVPKSSFYWGVVPVQITQWGQNFSHFTFKIHVFIHLRIQKWQFRNKSCENNATLKESSPIVFSLASNSLIPYCKFCV